MTVHDLSIDQLAQLRARALHELYDICCYGYDDDIISDDEMREYWADYTFTEDDFFC